jgi:hypothetical protein
MEQDVEEPPLKAADVDGRGEKLTITLVAPNGARQTDRYQPHEKVGHELDQAVKSFGRTGDLDPSISFVLVRGTTVLENGLTLEVAGVRPGDELKVRSQTIPGDGACTRS